MKLPDVFIIQVIDKKYNDYKSIYKYEKSLSTVKGKATFDCTEISGNGDSFYLRNLPADILINLIDKKEIQILTTDEATIKTLYGE